VASPLAHKLSAEIGVPLNGVQGTGPNGRIIAADVQEAKGKAPAPQASAKAASPQAIGGGAPLFEDLSVSGIRKTIAQRLTFSKQNVPHYYVTVSVQVDNMMKMRKRLNEASAVKISVNDIVLKASALASVKVPATNSSWMDSHIRQFKNVNMSVAIQTDHGLMAPNIKAVNLKGLEQIS